MAEKENRLTAKHRKQDKVGEADETGINGKAGKKRKSGVWWGIERGKQREWAETKGVLSQCEELLENKER